jgi:two-component system response regulator FixJ
MSERPPVVYVVDDDEVTRNYFDAVLSGAHLTSCRVESASVFLEIYDPCQPGCLLLDIQMPGMTGIALQHQLNLRGALIPLIFVTGHADVSMAVEAMLRGAFNFLLKPVAHEALLACVRKALDHDADNRAALWERGQMMQRFESLTARERDVLLLLVAGRSNKVMAGELRLSQRTVELHRARVMEKTGSRSLAQLIRMAMEANVALHGAGPASMSGINRR